MHETIYAPDYYILEHHGILGQKWGVRRYQNKDGSFTAAGKARYNKLTDKYTHTQDDTVAGAVIALDRINRKYGYGNNSARVQRLRRAAVDKNLKPGSLEAYKLQKMDKKGGYTTPVMVTAKAFRYRRERNTNLGAAFGGVVGAAVGRAATEHLHPEDYKMYNDVIDSYISTMADPKYRSRPQYLAVPSGNLAVPPPLVSFKTNSIKTVKE